MKKAHKRENHSVKVIQCKRKPCLSIGEPPYEAEDLIGNGTLHAEPGTAQPSQAAKGPGCSCSGRNHE